MANIKSQKKRNRQNVVRHERNKAVRSELKTRAKNALAGAESGDPVAAAAALKEAQRRLDTAAAKKVVHPRTAARRKSRLTKRVNARLG